MNIQKEDSKKFRDVLNIVVKTLKTYIKNYWWKFLIIAFLLALDLVTKSLIVKFDANGDVIENQVTIIKNVLYILPTANTGAAWSSFSGYTTLLIVLTFVFLAVIIAYDICFKKKSVFFGISTGMIVAGAIGNLIDRLAFGKVRDFIYFSPINFPVFNVADICLTIGIILFVIYMLFLSTKSKDKQSQTVQNNAENNIKNLYLDNTDNDIKSQNISSDNMTLNNNDNNSQNNVNNAGDSDAKDNS